MGFLTKQQIKEVELEKLAELRARKSAQQALERQLDLDLKRSKASGTFCVPSTAAVGSSAWVANSMLEGSCAGGGLACKIASCV